MTSRLRNLQIEWNQLVPQAQARGLRGVRPVSLYPEGLHERIPHRASRLEWLRRELNMTAVFSTPVSVSDQAFTFGVELELIMPVGMTHGDLARHIQDAGIACQAEMYNHSVRSGWKIVTDGSLGDYRRGAEVVSPVLSGDEGFAQLRKVCETLTRVACKVNKSCGLHVHVGARNENLGFFKSLVRLYQQAEPVIDSFLAPSRRASNNLFCRSIRLNGDLDNATNLEQVANVIGQSVQPRAARNSGRYCKINLQSFGQHGTVEFRQHQGTVEADKAENWVRFCLRLALAARKGSSPATTIEALIVTIGASESETRYIINRIAYFARLTARRAA